MVRLADDVKQTVVYLGIPDVNQEQEMAPKGTGFLVAHDGATYIVTAAHVAQLLDDIAFGVRLNKKGDDQGQIDRIDFAKWFYHPDETVDVAVMPYQIPEWSNGVPFKKWFVSEFKRGTKDIGSGDLVYVVGVYKFLHGKKRNMPAVHVGHIAAMADGEEIIGKDWMAADPDKAKPISMYGHLVQVQTLPASSGSPVFVRRTIHTRLQTNKENLTTAMYGSVWLLGLWHGAWGDATRMIALPDGTIDMGTGMGVVIPATRILEALDNSELVELRKKTKEEKAKLVAVTPKSDIENSKGDELLRTMLNTKPRPISKRAPRGKRKKAAR